MTLNEYQQAAVATAGKGSAVESQLCAVLGMCGESGELSEEIDKLILLRTTALKNAQSADRIADLYKKHWFHDHPLQKQKILEELGDSFWYPAYLAWLLGFDLEEVMIANLEKLKKRYPNGFDAEKSKNREEVK